MNYRNVNNQPKTNIVLTTSQLKWPVSHSSHDSNSRGLLRAPRVNTFARLKTGVIRMIARMMDNISMAGVKYSLHLKERRNSAGHFNISNLSFLSIFVGFM